MEGAYFLYNNYPYMIAAYGYYKMANTSYNNVQNGIQFYEMSSKVYRYFFPRKIKNNWIELEKEIRENTQLIDVDKDTLLIEQTEDDWDIIEAVKKETFPKISSCKADYQKDSTPPSHTSHTSDPHKASSLHKDYHNSSSLSHSH